MRRHARLGALSPPAAALCAALVLAAALSGCAGQDVKASTRSAATRAVKVGAATWYVPTTVVIGPSPTGASPSKAGTTASGNDPYTWTVQGSGTWAGRDVKVFARPANGVRDVALVTAQMLGLAQVGGIPSFSSLGQHAVSVLGADASNSVLFSYRGSDGSGQGMWVAAVQTKSTQGVLLQVATPGKPIDPAFAQTVVDSLQFTKP